MSGRGGRERFRRDYPSRYEEKSMNVTGRSNNNNPPSRHLWVGNLSHHIVESELADHFMQFGPLESVAFQPGRSYAFINFKRDDDAIDAMKTLQGVPVAGSALRIEFAKADKPLNLNRDGDYSWEERSPALRGSPLSQREFRGCYSSPEPKYSDKSKLSDKNPEPSEVLWIGFPALLKVDEFVLRKAFSPFGDIEKITTFPGRSYAFVRFRSLSSARRARDNLQGKLFGNPRVHICFAKSESGSGGSGRSSINAPASPYYKSSGRQGSSEALRQDRHLSFNGDCRTNSPDYVPYYSGDSDAYDFNRQGSSRSGGMKPYEHRRVGDKVRPQEIYEHPFSPSRDRHPYLGDFPPRFPQKGTFFEDPRNLPEDAHHLREAKKLKTGFLPSEKELPEYSLSELERQKHVFPRAISENTHGENKGFDGGPFAYRQTPDHLSNSPIAGSDRSDPRRSYDSFQMGTGAQQLNSVQKKRFTPEPENSSLTEWKWEGTIAKGGTPVCRARCFPVGKVMDIMLPEFLDCTARTGLDMLSKHYYQAAGAWVVFFVPESDADIGYYNEFMHYLEEKQRAAVAKLDDKTTLFLVPPSEFSQKVLKVPGKLSISGVVLSLEHPGLNNVAMPNQNEAKDATLLSYLGDTPYPKSSLPSIPVPPSMSLQELGNSGISNLSYLGNTVTSASVSVPGPAHGIISTSESHDERRHGYPIQQQNPTSGSNWSSHHLQSLISSRALQVSNGVAEPVAQEHLLAIQRAVPDSNSSHRTGGVSGIPISENSKPSQEMQRLESLSVPAGALQPEQLAQLAASLLGQQRQSGSSSVSSLDVPRQTDRVYGADSLLIPSQKYAVENNLVSSEVSTSQFGQVLQLQKQQEMSNVPQGLQMVQREQQRGANGNQQPLSSALQEDAEADPQKRLQATLQLAAVLLQQIQQGKAS